MKDKTQEQEQEQTELEQIEQAEQVAPDVIYQNNILALVDDVKQEPRYIKKSDEELKQDKSFFPILVNYIYNNYIGDLLDNKHCKPQRYEDIKAIDYLFNIYIDLVYLYKWNNKPSIVEFSILTGINKDTFYNWVNGVNNNNNNIASSDTGKESKYLTRERSDIVRKWINICESALLDSSDTIKDIFILKAKYNYKENNDVQITVNHKQVISSDDLPALLGVNNSNNS